MDCHQKMTKDKIKKEPKFNPAGPNWMLTIFPNDTTGDLESLVTEWQKINKIKGMCGQYEICPTTKRLHIQAYVKFTNTVKMTGVKKIFGESTHCELRHKDSTDLACYNYCTKTETRKEGTTPFFFGEVIGRQGERTDLEVLKDQITSGEITVEEIALEMPDTYHQYGRTLSKIEELALRKKFRTEMTKGIWYYGKTGVGKSHTAFKDFHPDTHYVWKLNDHGWQDGYTQQKTVIINDFRGEIPFGELLTLVDKWPHTVPRRSREPMPFISETVIITSCKHPREIYHRSTEDNDKLEQLERRFEIKELTSNVTFV